jgi:cytochrome b561
MEAVCTRDSKPCCHQSHAHQTKHKPFWQLARLKWRALVRCSMGRRAAAQLPPVPLPDAQHTVVRSMHAILPVLYVLLTVSVILGIASIFFKGNKSKQSFYSIYLLVAAALSGVALMQTNELDRLQHIWRIFLSLSDAAKVYYTVTILALLHVFARIYGPVIARDTAVMTSSRSISRHNAARPLGAQYPDNLDWKGDIKGSFAALCDILIAEVLIDLREEYDGIPEQIDWIARMLEYNVKGGKMNRGIGVIDVQRAFAAEAGRDLSDIEYCRASVLGWCIEWLQSCFLVADDVMDESITRRGNPCWYRLPDVKQVCYFVYELLLLHTRLLREGKSSLQCMLRCAFCRVMWYCGILALSCYSSELYAVNITNSNAILHYTVTCACAQIAINDSMIIDSLVYKVLKRHFEHEPYYNQMVELFHDVSYR